MRSERLKHWIRIALLLGGGWVAWGSLSRWGVSTEAWAQSPRGKDLFEKALADASVGTERKGGSGGKGTQARRRKPGREEKALAAATSRRKKVVRQASKRTKPPKKKRPAKVVQPRKPEPPPSKPNFEGPVQQYAATAHPLATDAALQMLKEGGTAMDAAIAAAFVLAVVEPYGSGLGGGGFFLVYNAKRRRVEALDFRERAPLKADPQMYVRLGEKGKEASREGHLAVAVPGMVAGLAEGAKYYSVLPWERLLLPAYTIAREGFAIHRLMAYSLTYSKRKLRKFSGSRATFFPKGRSKWKEGELLKQADLAWTLERLQKHGAADFYRGKVAWHLLREMKRGGGLITRDDLKAYKPRWVKPLEGMYRGYRVVSMPSPSSGGTHLIQMLNILAGFPLHQMKKADPKRLHLVAEAMRLAFADRARYQGDDRFAKVPTAGLLSMGYADKLRSSISPERAPVQATQPGDPFPFNHKHTSHISVVDRWQNAVSMTLTVNTTFGSGVTARGTGILLNNEMDDFTTLPGKPNAYKLIQSENNLIQPGKAPLSSMTPTMVFFGRSLRGVLGSPGGPTIITTVLQLILHLVDQQVSVEEAMKAPRLHHQWQPSELFVERRLKNKVLLRQIEGMGHRLKLKSYWGNAMALWITAKKALTGASDPRGDGLAAGF